MYRGEYAGWQFVDVTKKSPYRRLKDHQYPYVNFNIIETYFSMNFIIFRLRNAIFTYKEHPLFERIHDYVRRYE